ncbi:NAD(P)H-binding protein [Streptomyces sp. MP131-18]|uniref:NAD(P)H-binding protein n=1 Tax=Streptomyces sp. MP131-18 TaxID=1857892 RepID=UPI00097C27A0|nr:NAD(P)H-binding protein [Streptomyces sp. MP131-18]
MTDHPILVTGGTGTVGSRVVSLLRERGHAVRVASRGAAERFDWQDRATWDAALAGVRRMFVVPLDGTTLTRPFLARAADHGVGRVVLLSGRGVDVPGYIEEDPNGLGETHVDGEDAVRGGAADWTILRPGWFAQNFSEGFFREAVLSGELRLPVGNAAASFVDAADIAAVGVAALTEDGHAGQIYELSGPRALTLAEVAAEISAATGREVRHVPLPPGQFTAELIAQGWPAADAEGFLQSLSPLERGLDEHLSDGVRRALGREPRDFAAFARDAARAGAWPART